MPQRKIGKQYNRSDARSPIHSGLKNFMTMNGDKWDDARDSMKKQLIAEYQTSRDWRSQFEPGWIDQWNMYNMFSPEMVAMPEWRSKYFSAECYRLAETDAVKKLEAAYDNEPLWEAVPRLPSDVPQARVVEELLQSRVKQTDMYMTHAEMLKNTSIHGSAVGQIDYIFSTEYTGTRLRNIDLGDWFPDPMSADIVSSRFSITRSLQHIQQLYEMQDMELYYGIDEIPDNNSNAWMTYSDRLRLTGKANVSDDNLKGYHEVLEYWGKWYSEETDEYFDVLTVLIDREFIVRFEECPFYIQNDKHDMWYALKPLILFKDIVVPGCLYGKGIVEVLSRYNKVLNDLRNQQMDASAFALAPVFNLDLNSGINPYKVAYTPGSIIAGNIPDALTPVKKDHNIITVAMAEGEMVKQDGEAAVGLYDASVGREGKLRKSATEYQGLSNVGSDRARGGMRTIALGGMAQQAKMMYQMERQFTDEKIMLQTFDQSGTAAFYEITPTELNFSGDISLQQAAVYGQKAQVIQRLIQFIDLASGSPEVGRRLNWELVLKQLAMAMGIKDKNIIMQVAQTMNAAQGGQAVQGTPTAQLPPAGGTGQAGNVAAMEQLASAEGAASALQFFESGK